MAEGGQGFRPFWDEDARMEAYLEEQGARLGRDTQEFATEISELVDVYEAAGALPRARSWLEEELRIRTRAQGGMHPATLMTCHRLAMLLHRMGLHAEAEPFYARAHDALEATAAEKKKEAKKGAKLAKKAGKLWKRKTVASREREKEKPSAADLLENVFGARIDSPVPSAPPSVAGSGRSAAGDFHRRVLGSVGGGPGPGQHTPASVRSGASTASTNAKGGKAFKGARTPSTSRSGGSVRGGPNQTKTQNTKAYTINPKSQPGRFLQ